MLKIRCQNCNLFYDGDVTPVCPHCTGSNAMNMPNKGSQPATEKTQEKSKFKFAFPGFTKKANVSSSVANAPVAGQNKPSVTFQGNVSFNPAYPENTNGMHEKNSCDATIRLSDFDKTKKLMDDSDDDIYSAYFSREQKAYSEFETEFASPPTDLNKQTDYKNDVSINDSGHKSLREEIDNSVNTEKTIGIIRTTAESSPVVGWLVGVKGAYQGESFELHQGKNNIGRSLNMSIALVKEKTVSRDKHAVVIFDPVNSKFYIVSGESNALTYLNGQLLLKDAELKPKDIIKLGSCEMIFIPLCDDTFDWNNYIE